MCLGSANGNYGFNGDIYGVLFYNAPQNAARIAQDVAYFQGPLLPAAPVVGICSGDSRTAGTDFTAPNNLSPYPYPTQMASKIPGLISVNLGVPGSTTADWVNQTNNAAGSGLFAPMPFQRSVVNVLLGVNDLHFLGGDSPATVAGRLQTLVNGWEADGHLTVVSTEIDFDGGFSASETWRAAYNAQIEALLPTVPGVRTLLRSDLNPLIGISGASSNPLYFSPDTVHPIGEAPGGDLAAGTGCWRRCSRRSSRP